MIADDDARIEKIDSADGETFEEWMTALRPHYMEAHADVMNDPNHSKEDMERWMAENKARFDAA